MAQNEEYAVVFPYELIKRVPDLTSNDFSGPIRNPGGLDAIQRDMVMNFLMGVLELDKTEIKAKQSDLAKMVASGIKSVLKQGKICIHSQSDTLHHIVLNYGKGLIVRLLVHHPNSKTTQERWAQFTKHMPVCKKTTLPQHKVLTNPIHFD